MKKTPGSPVSSFAGRRSSRKPRPTVMLADRVARRLITISGLGGIVAVSLVGLFLVWVVLPLLRPPQLTAASRAVDATPYPATGVVTGRIDAYGTMSWSLQPDGTIVVQDLATAAVLDRLPIASGRRPTATALSGDRCVLGFADGSAVTGTVAFTSRYPEDGEVPAELRNLAPGQHSAWNRGLLARTPEGQLRHQALTVAVDSPLALGSAPLLLVDVSLRSGSLVLAAVDSAGIFHHRIMTSKQNLLTGETTTRTQGGELDLGAEGAGRFSTLKLNDTGTLILLIGNDGRLLRLVSDGGDFAVSGRQDLTPAPGVHVTSVEFLAGKVSLAVGDSRGGVTVWFPTSGEPGEVALMTAVHALTPGTAAVTALGASERSRMLAVGYADGSLQVFNATNEQRVGRVTSQAGAIRRVALSPRQDQLLAIGEAGSGLWRIEAPYAEVTLGTLLRPIWYEGYPGPAYVWQSSSASDSFEPKLSLVPLIFGTLKATFYSLLFGLPLAMFAAVYTSEFLPRRMRTSVKPVIEIMASLPSVVLGFLAALVVAPLVESRAVEVIAVILLAPFFLLLGAHLWQLLPRDIGPRLAVWRPVAVALSLAVGAAVAWRLAGSLESLLFAGNFKAWLDGRVGTGVAGWLILLSAPCALLVAWFGARHGDGLLRRRGARWRHRELAWLDLGRFLVWTVATVGLALLLGWLASASGWDPRGSLFGTYVQRNALVVGVAMGFAVIPLIYTISEDALVAVPDHLRAASLGAGASKWQTAVRVVIPPAMSGLFSAAMIGLGRAAGETMIVLMAAGNTPIMEMNIFNGFRTLSANLAVELPEAVQNSTHYRVLFLAALTLFVMTFVLNTVAEAVRLRFRRKTSRL